jgi:hypothetical protein
VLIFSRSGDGADTSRATKSGRLRTTSNNRIKSYKATLNNNVEKSPRFPYIFFPIK